MFNILRFYNQNRGKIWIIIITIIFAITIIRTLNKNIEEQGKQKINNTEVNISQNETNENKYEKQSESLVSDGSVSKRYQDDFGNLIDSFFKNCIEGNYDKAYELLSNDCKNTLYKSEKLFEELYCKGKFNKSKSYDFQSWSTYGGNYVYLVRIFDDMLSSGKDNTENYIQDYVTVVNEKNNYKLNISSFIKKNIINKQVEQNGITINVKESYVYMDYEIYNIEIVNLTGNKICLTNMEDNSEVYLLDSNETKFKSLINENTIDDFILDNGYKKSIQIKFNDSYRGNLRIEKMFFDKVILNYDDFLENNQYNDFKQIEIEF